MDYTLCKNRLFVIFYDRNLQKYFLRYINDSTSKNLIYIKITQPFAITQKQYFSMCQLIFSICPIDVGKNNGNELKVVIYSKEKEISNSSLSNFSNYISNRNVYYFKPKDSPITIGRYKCTITLDYSSLSKKQCSIVYNPEEMCWEIFDGFEEKPSTNGTWLTLNSKYDINDTTFVKIGNNVIKINPIN
jgi:hypothetical protein